MPINDFVNNNQNTKKSFKKSKKIRKWFFSIHLVLKLVVIAKIPQDEQSTLVF